MSGLKVAVCLHAYGNVTPQTFFAWAAEMGAMRREGIERIDLIPPFSDALLSRVRSCLATQAVENGYDVMIWIDRDQVWAPGDVADLALRCAQVEGVVGALFPYRSEEMRGKGFPWRSLPGTTPADLRLGMDELLECESVSGGFVAFWVPAIRFMIERLSAATFVDPDMRVRRCKANPVGCFWDVCRPVSIPYGDGSTERDGLFQYSSDDWILEHRLRFCGTKVYAWLRPLLRHVGDKEYSVADALGLAGTADEVEGRLRALAKVMAEEEAQHERSGQDA